MRKYIILNNKNGIVLVSINSLFFWDILMATNIKGNYVLNIRVEELLLEILDKRNL